MENHVIKGILCPAVAKRPDGWMQYCEKSLHTGDDDDWEQECVKVSPMECHCSGVAWCGTQWCCACAVPFPNVFVPDLSAMTASEVSAELGWD